MGIRVMSSNKVNDEEESLEVIEKNEERIKVIENIKNNIANNKNIY